VNHHNDQLNQLVMPPNMQQQAWNGKGIFNPLLWAGKSLTNCVNKQITSSAELKASN